jgi:lactoylglutathione lyase
MRKFITGHEGSLFQISVAAQRSRDDKGKTFRLIRTMVTKLLHTRYRVTDLDKTVAFYRDIIGLQEVDRKVSPRGSKLVFLKAPQSEELIEICEFPASGPVIVGPDLTHLAFAVDDLDAFARHAAAKGHPLSDGPTPTSNGSIIAFVDAPEGYEVEIIQRPKAGV